MSIMQETYNDHSLCHPHFINGVEFLKRNMLSQAAHSFEQAYEQVNYRDPHYNKYASFAGLCRVLLGDHGGLALCREVARNELYDGDVFHNLARVEWQYGDRKRTVEALTNGLRIDEAHPGLQQFRQRIGVRKRSAISFLPRNCALNNRLGILFRRK